MADRVIFATHAKFMCYYNKNFFLNLEDLETRMSL